MKRTVLGDSGFKSFAYEKFETVIVDLLDRDSLSEEQRNEYEELYNNYGVGVNPTAVIATPGNREIGRVEGYDRKGPRLYVKKLEEVLGES